MKKLRSRSRFKIIKKTKRAISAVDKARRNLEFVAEGRRLVVIL